MSRNLETYIQNLILTVKKECYIFPIRWEGETYWVKRVRPAKETFWHRLQGLINFLIPLEMIKTTLAKNPKEALAHELKQLAFFKANHLPAPELKCYEKEWFCMSEMGPTLHHLFEQKKMTIPQVMLAAQALATLHEKGGYHGRAKLNDLTFNQDHSIGFIDFEENPVAVMSLNAAQNRDLYLFISSLCRWDKSLAQIALETYLEARSNSRNYTQLKRLIFLLKPIKCLKFFIHRMSKDLRQAYEAQLIFEKYL